MKSLNNSSAWQDTHTRHIFPFQSFSPLRQPHVEWVVWDLIFMYSRMFVSCVGIAASLYQTPFPICVGFVVVAAASENGTVFFCTENHFICVLRSHICMCGDFSTGETAEEGRAEEEKRPCVLPCEVMGAARCREPDGETLLHNRHPLLSFLSFFLSSFFNFRERIPFETLARSSVLPAAACLSGSPRTA